MPVEIRTSDGRHWARPARQNHALPPIIRIETPFQRRRRRVRATLQMSLFFAAAWLAALFLLSGKIVP